MQYNEIFLLLHISLSGLGHFIREYFILPFLSDFNFFIFTSKFVVIRETVP